MEDRVPVTALWWIGGSTIYAVASVAVVSTLPLHFDAGELIPTLILAFYVQSADRADVNPVFIVVGTSQLVSDSVEEPTSMDLTATQTFDSSVRNLKISSSLHAKSKNQFIAQFVGSLTVAVSLNIGPFTLSTSAPGFIIFPDKTTLARTVLRLCVGGGCCYCVEPRTPCPSHIQIHCHWIADRRRSRHHHRALLDSQEILVIYSQLERCRFRESICIRRSFGTSS